MEPTIEDREAATRILGEAAGKLYLARQSFEDEIAVILAVQNAVLSTAPKNDGIPLKESREPEDLHARRSGLCYDRSRAIEKLLRLAGFKTRHVFVYSTASSLALASLLTPQVPSHAVSEVLTSKGWLLIDSNRRWIGLADDDRPISIEQIKTREAPADGQMDPIFSSSFSYVYGLYSRHGMFFEPYTPIPDVNWSELLENFTSYRALSATRDSVSGA